MENYYAAFQHIVPMLCVDSLESLLLCSKALAGHRTNVALAIVATLRHRFARIATGFLPRMPLLIGGGELGARAGVKRLWLENPDAPAVMRQLHACAFCPRAGKLRVLGRTNLAVTFLCSVCVGVCAASCHQCDCRRLRRFMCSDGGKTTCAVGGVCLMRGALEDAKAPLERGARTIECVRTEWLALMEDVYPARVAALAATAPPLASISTTPAITAP